MRLFAQNYRVLHKVEWTPPRGVCALVGPNGSGKTTLLDIPELFRHAIEQGMQRAIEHHGGPAWLRYQGADPMAPIAVGCELGDVLWNVDLSPVAAGAGVPQRETILIGGELVAQQTEHERHFRSDSRSLTPERRPLLARLADDPAHAKLLPLLSALSGYRLYRQYQTSAIRANGSPYSSDDFLHVSGKNVFSVLRNWRDRRETMPRWSFVVEGLQRCFPEVFAGLDFDVAGQVVTGRILKPGFDDMLPVHLAPEGWFTGLLHLTAVASTERGGLVGIDEPENALHPFAIRGLFEVISDWADEHDLRVFFATHSPVLLDQFKPHPERVFVMEPAAERLPVRLDELRKPDWLAHFSLGDESAGGGAQDRVPGRRFLHADHAG